MSVSDELAALGIDADGFDPHAVDAWQRLPLLDGKRRKRDGWARIHRTEPLIVSAGNWKTGEKSLIVDGRKPTGRRRPVRERSDVVVQHDHVARFAWTRWSEAKAADPAHTYLHKKRIRAFGIRQHGNCLLVPMMDEFERLWSLQRIFPDGAKRFLKGGRTAGLSFVLGTVDGVLLLVEGIATGATLHGITGHPCAICFTAGNLAPAGYELRRRYPSARFIVCGDNDRKTPGNPGLTAAEQATRENGDKLLAPQFDGDDPGTDWNDYALLYGAQAVREVFTHV